MKIAIIYNFMDNIGGAEIVNLTLARELKADIYTTNIDWKKIRQMGFFDVSIKSIGKVPINAPFRQEIAYWKFRRLKLKGYDFYIIAGDWAVGAGRNNKPNLWYVHSPMREIFDLYRYTQKNMVFWKRPLFGFWVLFRRILIKKDAQEVNKIVSNSKNVQDRIRKYFKRNSKIIYPCIDTSDYNWKKDRGFWLSVNRLINHKRVEMQLDAFKKMPDEQLIIVGSYEKSAHFQSYAKKILKQKPKNVKIISWVDHKKLKKLYSECKGFITTSKDEDFGLTAVEAMASGKPVIAPKEGGYKETILNGKTGILIEDLNSDRLVFEIKNFEKSEKYKKASLEQSKKFDTKEFIRKIKQERGFQK